MRGVIAVLLAGLGWLALRALPNRSRRPGPPQQNVERAGAAEHTGKPAAVEQPSRAGASNGSIRSDSPGDEEHKRAERAHWRIANFTGIATASAAIFAAIFAAGAYFAASEQAGIARNALIVSDRPWIRVEKISVERFQIVADEGGFVIGLAHMTVKNLGHSPAINLFINSELKPLGRDQSSLDVTTAICKSALERRSGFALQVVFPNEGEPSGKEAVPVQLHASAEDIAQAKKARLNSWLEQEKLVGGVEATRRRREAEAAPFEPAFAFAGCITYFSYSGLIGQTGFLLNIYRRVSLWGQPITYDEGGFDVSQTDDVPLKEINVVPATLGGTYVR